jgi:hypothetical protein
MPTSSHRRQHSLGGLRIRAVRDQLKLPLQLSHDFRGAPAIWHESGSPHVVSAGVEGT